jgi:hypothetical protein
MFDSSDPTTRQRSNASGLNVALTVGNAEASTRSSITSRRTSMGRGSRRWQGTAPGTTSLSPVVAAALKEGKLLLYQTLEANRGAVQIALNLGYEQYARHVAVRLKREAPLNPPLGRRVKPSRDSERHR